MEVSFIGQGFEPESKNSVGNILQSKLDDRRYSNFFFISAFASPFAMDFLEDRIMANQYRPLSNYTVIVGVDQEGTSKEALERLDNLHINSYVFFQKESPIFHPKIYLCEGENDIALIIGSSNLTGPGLFNNIESSTLIEFKTDDEQGKVLLGQLKSYFESLFNHTDPNLFRLDSSIIKSLIDCGIVPSSQSWGDRYSKYHLSNEVHSVQEEIPIPKRKIARIPRALKGKYKTNKVVSELISEIEYTSNVDFINDDEYKLLWSCSKLTRRDLNIPTGENTNETGSMLLKKGNLKDIDQRHYFYDVVFSSLDWKKIDNSLYRYIAECNFRMVILGIDYGTYLLKIAHNSDTHSKSYLQNNSTTSLRWEEAKKLVRQEELLGKSLYILKNTNSGEFVIEIK